MKVTTDSCLFGAWAAKDMKTTGTPLHILDIGSGSGLLSLMLAQQIPGSIDGIELQESDYHQSVKNISASPFYNRMQVFNADARSFSYPKKYDSIISNPPFYESDLKSSVKGKNIAHHDDGLKLNELIPLIEKLLQPKGAFYLLLPAKRQEDIQEIITASRLFINEVVFVRQTENHAPFRIILKGSFSNTGIATSEIVIKKKNFYTDAFIQLLQPYYLDKSF
jgi:tRNA1Val (adenine37-N6)-methyltransferase